MKKIILARLLLLLIFLISNNSFSQVPDWIKNALPAKESHLKKVDKIGDKYMEKYKSYPENSNEKKIYYRVKYINYLKRLETLNDEVLKVADSLKPFSFPLFISPNEKAYLLAFEEEKEMTQIKIDTLLYIVDILEGYSKSMPVQKNSYNNFSKIIVQDGKNNKFVLKFPYHNYNLAEYPHFNQWKEKYFLYASKEAQRIRKTEKIDQEEAIKKRKEKDIELERISKELKATVLCTTSTDDFTGFKTTQTNQKRLIVLENETIKKMYPNEDYEMFVCAFTAIKAGNKRTLDIYLKYNTGRPLDFYGIIEKDALVEFKLENNKIIKLSFTNTVMPTIRTKYKYSYYENSLSISEKDVSEFIASDVKKIRIHFSKGYKDYDITEDSGLFTKQMKCIK